MTSQGDNTTDPFAAWRQWLAESERQWNSFFNEAMSSEEFTRNVGQFMDFYLNAQKSMSEAMGRYFSTLNMPSRTDVLNLGERLTTIEEKLEALQAKVDTLAAANQTVPNSGSESNSTRSRPRRTRKPPESSTE